MPVPPLAVEASNRAAKRNRKGTVLQLHHKGKQHYTTAIKKVLSESSQAFPRAMLLVTVEASEKYAE